MGIFIIVLIVYIFICLISFTFDLSIKIIPYLISILVGALILGCILEAQVKPKEITTTYISNKLSNITYETPKQIIKTEYDFPWYILSTAETSYIIKEIK